MAHIRILEAAFFSLALVGCSSAEEQAASTTEGTDASPAAAGGSSAGSGGTPTGTGGKGAGGSSAGTGGASIGAGGTSNGTGGGSAGSGGTEAGTPSAGLASKYPGDVGIDKDPAVLWVENFEEGSVSAVTSRYESFQNAPGMTLVADVPAKSGGKAAMKWTSGVGANATDLYKKLTDHDEVFVRWYAKYQAGVTWHHSGMWFGGYNPASSWPNPQAGLKPNGDDRFAIAIEPQDGIGTSTPRLDFYNYWMKMHSWMDQPSGTTAYYGNGLVHQKAFTVDDGQWICLEVHARVNSDPASAKDAVLEVWKNDALVQSFDGKGPLGYWIKDKFCPKGADGPECTDYPAPLDTVLDLQVRSTTSYAINYFWPQNYITEGPNGDLLVDDMVVATARIGCLQ